MLTVIGFPRSGTNFLTRMLARYIDGPGPVWPGTPAHPHVKKIHWQYQVKDGDRLVYIYRDPRDCALSGWGYVKHHYMPDLTLMEFLEGPFSGHWELWPTGWREHTQHWLRSEAPMVPYEMLCLNRRQVLQTLVAELGMTVEKDGLAHAISHSYLEGKKRTGNVGRWVHELPKDAASWLDEYCGDLMQEVGYA